MLAPSAVRAGPRFESKINLSEQEATGERSD